MPRIPIYTATERNLPAELPPNYALQHQLTTPIAAFPLGVAIEKTADTLTTIADRLQQGQNQVDTASLIGQHEGAIKQIQLDIKGDPIFADASPQARTAEFVRRSQEMTQHMIANAPNRIVGQALQGFVGRHLPTETLNFHADNLQLQTQQVTSKLIDQMPDASRLATVAPTPDKAKEYIDG